MARTGLSSTILLAVCLLAHRADGETTPSVVELPDSSPACVRWAADELNRAVRKRLDSRPQSALNVRLFPIPTQDGGVPEGYRIRRGEDGALVVAGTDAVGAMYGLLDLTEQIATAPPVADGTALREALTGRDARPTVRWRGLNIFLHLTPDGQVAAWFHDEDFWRRLLDLLARSRFNWIDLHGAYDPQTTVFSALWPHFTTSGPPDAAVARNRAMLKHIVELAGERGLRVALMTYIDRDPGEKDRAGTTARNVRELLADGPDLWMLGSRVKRAGGEATARFEDSLAHPARAAGFRGPLYTRSWGTDRPTVEDLSKASAGPFFVEVKYNGEQLGLPYPAIQGWGEGYSYQNFLDRPRRFDVLWQVRANGTCRVFPWADAQFVRRAARSFSLGGATGFSIEPHWAYYPPEAVSRYRDAAHALGEGERYLFERDWAWYLLWGRLTYDPQTPDSVFLRAWVARHGPRAGDAALRTLMWMSRTLTTLYAAQACGVDHRDMAPEMDIGVLTRNRDHGRSLEELCAIPPLDRSRGCSADEFAAAAAGGRNEPRLTPIDFAAELERLAVETGAAAEELTVMLTEAANPGAARTLALEARAMASLGLSGAARLRALTAFAFFQHTRDGRWLDKGGEDLHRAATRWNELAGIADKLYLPIQDPLRAGRDFTWASVAAHYQRLLAYWEKAVRHARKGDRFPGGEPKLGDVYARARALYETPEVTFTRRNGNRFVVDVRFPADTPRPGRLSVLFKPLDSERPWSVTGVEEHNGRFTAEFKEPPDGLLIQFQAVDDERRGWLWPDTGEGSGFYWSIREAASTPSH